MIREFRDVPLPRWHDDTPLVEGCDERLAIDLQGIPICLDDPTEDCAFPPAARREPLGTVTSAMPAGDHVLATIVMDQAALGAEQIIDGLERGELAFGLWGIAETIGNEVLKLRPTSVRISNNRAMARRR